MKYLFLTPTYKYSLNYEIREFASAEELVAHAELHGTRDAIVATRVGLKLQVCDWPDDVREGQYIDV